MENYFNPLIFALLGLLILDPYWACILENGIENVFLEKLTYLN